MLPSSFVTKQRIEKGWSGDKKYCVTDAQGNRFLLRVSPVEQDARKKSIFARMGQVAALGVPMGKPLAFGIAEDGVYAWRRAVGSRRLCLQESRAGCFPSLSWVRTGGFGKIRQRSLVNPWEIDYNKSSESMAAQSRRR